MPMTWNADADAKLFAAVIKTSNVKLDYPALAAEMGPECTPKAIMHRITNLRNRARVNDDGAGPATSSADGTTPVKSNPSPSTPKSRGKAAGGTPKTPSSNTAATGTPTGKKRGRKPKNATAPEAIIASTEEHAATAPPYSQDDEEHIELKEEEAVAAVWGNEAGNREGDGTDEGTETGYDEEGEEGGSPTKKMKTDQDEYM